MIPWSRNLILSCSCVDGIKSTQTLLDESEQRLEEMNHRKLIVRGIVFHATEQPIATRKALCERRHKWH